MHRDLKKLLHKAKGVSGFVVAAFIDVRGFSSFAKLAESSEAAVFLRSFYNTVLDDYFADADFFKPTGDGLLIVRQYEEENLADVVNSSISRSVRLNNEFPNLFANDAMINFPVPELIGIGLARGAVTSLVSGKKSLDYSGRPLNLAARLMDIARPSGVVFDASFASGLLEDDLVDQFRAETAYIRGLAEDEPMDINVSRDVEVSSQYRKPIGQLAWAVECKETVPLRELKPRGLFHSYLSQEPLDKDGIEVALSHPAVMATGRAHKRMRTLPKYKAKYIDDAGKHVAQVNYGQIAADLAERGVRDSWSISIEIRYQVQPDDSHTR